MIKDFRQAIRRSEFSARYKKDNILMSFVMGVFAGTLWVVIWFVIMVNI